MSLPENEVAADNQRRRMEELSKSPVGGVIESAISVARPAVAVASALVTSGNTATGLAVAGSIIGGLGIVDWFRRLGSSKVDENLESLGQATEDALDRVANTLREHGTSMEEIKARIESNEFKDGMASAALQALRTTNINRLARMALLLANGVKEDDLEPESLDDMTRAAVELKDADLILLGEIYQMQISLLNSEWIELQVNQRWNNLSRLWQEYWNKNQSRFNGYQGMLLMASFGRLESLGMIAPGPDRASAASPVASSYLLLPEGKKFYERLRVIAV